MLLLCAILWGSSYGIQALMSQTVGNYTIIFLKTCSGFFLVGYCLLTNKCFNKKTISAGILIGLCNGTGLLLQQYALSTANVSKVSFISGLYIIFVPILSIFILKVKPKIRFWFAVVIACFGMYFLCVGERFVIEIGDIITLIATIFFALQIIFIHKYSDGVDTIAFCGIQQMIVATMCLPLMLIIDKPTVLDFKQIIFQALFMMIGAGTIAQLLQNTYQKQVDATLATLIMSLESVFGAISGVVFLNARLTPIEVFGCILIFISIIVAENQKGFDLFKKIKIWRD